jgi:hypothetical protein
MTGRLSASEKRTLARLLRKLDTTASNGRSAPHGGAGIRR